MSEKSKGIWNPVWPGRRAATLRLLIITAILFPISWAIYALLVGSWGVTFGEEESVRHFREWMIILAAAISVIFLASLLPVFGAAYRFLNWLFSPRIIKRVVVAGIWLMTLIVLFYVEEDWRGSRAWNNYRQQLEASGADLNISNYVPKTVPDEENFAATPVIKSWFQKVDKSVDTNSTETFVRHWEDDYKQAEGRIAEPTDKTNRQFFDLEAWAKAFEAVGDGLTNSKEKFPSGKLDPASRTAAAPAVLAGLKADEATLAELRAASARPYSHYPVFYDLENPWGILLPHLINVRDACRRLSLRASAELATGRNDEALADVKLILYLADSVKDEPFLISYLVRAACVQLAVQPAWEGMAQHAWSDGQLQEMKTRFQQYDFVTALKWPLDSERAAGAMVSELVKKKGLALLIELIGPGQPTSGDRKVANAFGAIIPNGWYDLERVNYCRLYQLQLDGVFDSTAKQISAARLEANQQALQRELTGGNFAATANGFLHHRAIATIMVPSLDKIPIKAAKAQTAADEAALACALERYHLANGNYPDTLSALEPKFISSLPHDILTGKPYEYRRTSDGRFALLSSGWPAKTGTAGKNQTDESQGHWTWEYPAK